MSTNSRTPDTEIARLVDRFMRRIHASLNARAPEFDVHRVGPNGGILLLTLAEIEPARIQDLVREMSRDKSQMTRLIGALETKGLIERKGAPNDARVSLMSLTPEGRQTVLTLQSAVAEVIDDLLAPLTSYEKQAFKEILHRTS